MFCDILQRQARVRQPHEAMPRQITPRDLWVIIGASFTVGVILTASVLLGVIR